MGEAAIEFAGVVKDYGRTRALAGIDLTVERGQIFGFLGPNGAGKTTAIRVLLDLIRPTAGIGARAGLGLPARDDRRAEARRLSPRRPADVRGMRGDDFLDFIDSFRPRAARSRLPPLADRPAGAGPGEADPRAVEGQPPEARTHPGADAPAGIADPRRADERSRPAGAGRGGAHPRGSRGRRADRLLLVARAAGGRAAQPHRRDHPRRTHRRASRMSRG